MSMTPTEIAYKVAALLAGEDSPEVRANVAARIAVCPLPNVSMTLEEFAAAVNDCGGAEAVRRFAIRRYHN